MGRARRLVDAAARLVTYRRVGDRPVPHLVIHATLPSGARNQAARSLGGARAAMARRGVAFVDAEEGWKSITLVRRSDDDPSSLAGDLRRSVPGARVGRPLSAVVVSSERALGRSGVIDAAELRALRPGAEAALEAVLAAVPARRVTVVLDLPPPVELAGEVIVGRVVSGLDPRVAVDAAASLYDDLADRVGRVAGVDDVHVEVSGVPAVSAARVLASAGVGGVEVADPPAAPPRWTLRGVMAVAAVDEHVDPGEGRRAQRMLRALTAVEPARPPAALLPMAERRRLDPGAHVAGGLGISRLHLHVGIQKTATTTVQAAMSAARDLLAASGVVYVDRGDMMRLRDLRAWGAYRGTGTASFDRFAAQLQATVRRYQSRSEQAGRPSDVVFISNESFVGAVERGPFFERPFRPRAERALFEVLDVLQPESCHLSLVTRRQDTLIESLYMWQLHGGESFAFDRFRAALERRPEALHYTDLASRLAAVVGVESMTVRPYEMIHDGLGPFLDSLLDPMRVSVDFDALDFARRANPSHSERAMELARAINPHLDTKDEVVRVREFLRRTFPLNAYPAATLLDDDDRRRLLALFAADNEALFHQWMPDFPPEMYYYRSHRLGTG
jgi:hypothetical protein